MSDISNRTIVALLAVALVVSVAGTMYSVSELGQVSMVFKSVSGLGANDRGNVTLNISEVVSILVHNSNPVLAAGGIAEGSSFCEMSMGGDPMDPGWYGNNVNSHSADCEKGFNSSTGRENMFHLIENNGNVDANVTVKIASVNGAPGLGANLCSFLTGINDNNPASGCSDGTSSTLTNVTAVFEAIPNSVNSTGNASVRQHFDNVVTEDNRDDTRPSVGATTKVALDNSPKQLLGNFKSGNEEDEAAVAFHVIIPVDALPGSRTAELIYEAAKA